MDEQAASAFDIETIEPRATIVIDDPRFNGVEVDACVLLSASYYFALRQWGDQERAADPASAPAKAEALRVKAEIFIEHGRPSWNIARRGVPIAPSVDAMLRLPPALAHTIVDAWIGAVGTVPLPLPVAPTTGRASSGQAPKKSTKSPRSTSRAAGRSTKSTARR